MDNKELLHQKIKFYENKTSYEDARIALFGAPLDSNSSFRPGARFAPEEIRKVFEALEDYSPILEKSLSEASFYDLGDLPVLPGSPGFFLEQLELLTKTVIREGKKPLVIGGDHSITPAVVKALLKNGYPDLTVLQFDAHLDLRPSYLGEENSHACSIYAVIKAGVKKVYQFGIRSGTEEEFQTAREKTSFFPRQINAPLKRTVKELGDKPVYITLDIDVVDPSFAPGTGTPEPGGISSAALLKSFSILKDLNIVGFDVVEINPPFDQAQITVMLGAKLLREALLIL